MGNVRTDRIDEKNQVVAIAENVANADHAKTLAMDEPIEMVGSIEADGTIEIVACVLCMCSVHAFGMSCVSCVCVLEAMCRHCVFLWYVLCMYCESYVLCMVCVSCVVYVVYVVCVLCCCVICVVCVWFMYVVGTGFRLCISCVWVRM